MGQPPCRCDCGRSGRVYPHVCGATVPSPPCALPPSGLSPRVWGNHKMKLYHGTTQRSIPTCVGQPSCPRAKAHSSVVYPHVCGATPLPMDSTGRSTRSIPTCVGQPASLPSCFRLDTVYPHVCGATGCSRRRRPDEEGLSPRVWGNPE